MAKVQEIGPYSAYALAVKYGYQGTEEEWVKEQEANRKAAEAAAAAAAQSAKDAAASASGVAQSGQQAVQNIQNAQTTALQAIDTAKQQAVQAAQAEAEKAATSAGQAASSAAEAVQSATSAAAEVGKVQSAGAAAVQAVQQAQSTATEAVSDAQQTATQAVSQAQTAAVSTVQGAGTTQTSAVASAASSALSGIADAKDAALSDVAQAGAEQVSAVGTAGTSAVQDVNDAKTAALEEIDAANAALPSPTQSDTGKVPTVKADGSAYELAGPYAPLSAAIRPTASGNPVSITDSVEWPLQGLKVYGKSTQVTTTGAQLFDITKAFVANDAYGISVSIDEEYVHLTGTVTGASKLAIALRLLRVSELFPEGSKIAYFDAAGSGVAEIQYLKLPTSLDDPYITITLTLASLTGTVDYHFKIMVGADTPTSWEPYTGGKPSPSPEYPQEIRSAGGGGSIGLTVSDGADQSQSLTISTPNGLPGIPVDSGGNYTDAEGQQWVCDEIDYARGVYVQRIGIKYVSLEDSFSKSGLSTELVNSYVLAGVSSFPGTSSIRNTLMSNYFIAGKNQGFSVVGCVFLGGMNSKSIYFSVPSETFPDAITFKNWAVENGLMVAYHLPTPIETPLSEEDIATYRALHTYDGTTVVSTAEDVAGLEVKYVADAQKYIDDRLTAAEQRIQELAAAQLNAQTGG